MAVIKVYDLSSVEEVKSIHNKVFQRQKEMENSEYTENNIMLVRTTNVFPSWRVVKPLSNTSHVVKNGSNFIYQAMYYEMDNNDLKKLETYQLYYRSTVHFTENGLVSSHMYGNFDNQDFIILDPLSEHIGCSDIRNYAGHDTFICGDVKLSEKAIIIIKSEKYDYFKSVYPEIDSFNVVLYNGIPENLKQKYIDEHSDDSVPEFYINDQRAIVEQVRMNLGYVPELVGSHYIINSPTSEKIVEVNNSLGEKYGVTSNSKHNYSKEYEEDYKKNLLITEIFNKMLLNFIMKNHNIDIINMNEEIGNMLAYKIIDIIGIEQVFFDIQMFNETIEKMKSLNMMPTSLQLLNNEIPDIYEIYLQINNDKKRK